MSACFRDMQITHTGGEEATQVHDHCADCAVGACEEPANDRLTDLSIDQPPDGEIPRTRHPNDWWEL